MKKKLIIISIIIVLVFIGKSFFEEKAQVKPPTFNYEESKLDKEVNIKMKSKTEGAKIYYTTNPNEELNVLCDTFEEGDLIPLEYDQQIIIRAFAIKKGMEDSKRVKKEYIIKRKTKEPEIRITRLNGKYTVTFGRDYSSDVYYTLNGDRPTRDSNLYQDRIKLDGSSVVKALAVKDGYWDSDIVIQDVSMKLEKPEIRISTLPNKNKQVEINSLNKNDEIYYTLNGKEPTRDNNLYEEKFIINKSSEIKAITVKEGYVNSDITTEEIKVKLIKPTIIVKDFGNNKKAEIVSPNENDKIHYTLNGEFPTERSNIYDGEIILRNTSIVQAKSIKENYIDSEIAESRVTVTRQNNVNISSEPKIENINIDISKTNNIKGIKVIEVENNNNIVLAAAGENYSYNKGINLSKISKSGKVIWNKNLDIDKKLKANSIIYDGKKYILLASNDSDIHIITINKNGEILKQNKVLENHLGVDIIAYNNYYYIGSIYNYNSDDPDISISKITPDLKYIDWQKKLNYKSKTSIENLYDIEMDQNNDLLIVGDTNQNGREDIYFSKINLNGEVLNEKIFEGNKIDSGYFIKSTIDNKYIIAGESNSKYKESSQTQNKNNILLLKLNEQAEIEIRKIIGGNNDDYPVSLSMKNNNMVLAANESDDQEINSKIYWLDNNLNIIRSEELKNSSYYVNNMIFLDDMVNLLTISWNGNKYSTRLINIINEGV
jgi:hypothetical protein